jgi:hypothetical protein|nr:MAG TPA: hypothetical protein [Caudoviricetes sp.]
MALKKKTDLKDLFSGPSSLLYQAAEIDLGGGSAITLAPELDLPVKVESLKIEQGDPSLTHYKIIGMNGDWDSTAEIGDFEISFTVPTKHADILKWAHGDDAITDNVQVAIGAKNYKGQALTPKKHKIKGTFIIEDDAQENLMILSGVALWAKPMLDDGKVYAIGLTGTMEISSSPNIAWLKKQ